MTYCFGFHYGRSVFLFADSVVTGAAERRSARLTSFGQLLYPDDGESLGESGIKIVKVTDRCLVAVAGSMRRAYDAVESLRTSLRASDDIHHAFRSLKLSMNGGNGPEAFELLIAISAAAKLELFYWNSSDVELKNCDANGLWMIGTPIDAIDAQLTDAARVMRKLNLNDDAMLSLMSGTYQSAVLQALTVAQGIGVGGLVLGARLDDTTVHWVRDTNFVVYGDADGAVDLIQVRHREGGFAVSSPKLEHVHLCLWNQDVTAWDAQWSKTLMESIFYRRACNWMFISYLGFGGFLVQHDEPFDSCNLFDARVEMQGLDGIAVREVLQQVLAEVIRRQDAPQFVYSHRSNCLQVVANALQELQGVNSSDLLGAAQSIRRITARTSKWDYKPFPSASGI